MFQWQLFAIVLLLLPIACSSDVSETPPEGYIFTADGSLAPKTSGKCRESKEEDDCPAPYNRCENSVCVIRKGNGAPCNSAADCPATSAFQCVPDTVAIAGLPQGTCINSRKTSQKQYWFVSDPIRPRVTGTCGPGCNDANRTDYAYNIMAKGYGSLDDWCMSQAQQSTDPSVRNISKWHALILANGLKTLGLPGPLGVPMLFERIKPAFLNRDETNPAGMPWQDVQNNYTIPNGNTNSCVDNICDKHGGESARQKAPNTSSGGNQESYTLAWLGVDNGCNTLAISGAFDGTCGFGDVPISCGSYSAASEGCGSFTNCSNCCNQGVCGLQCLNESTTCSINACLCPALDGSCGLWSASNLNFTGGNFQTGNLNRFWINGNTQASVYISHQGQSTPGCFQSQNLPVNTTYQNRIICLGLDWNE